MTEFVEFELPPEAQSWSPEMFCEFFSLAWSVEAGSAKIGSTTAGGYCTVLDVSCEPANRHADVDSIEVLDVSVADSMIHVRYAVSLSQFHPCQDRQDYWRFERTLIGELRGSLLRFSLHEPLPERSTDDEL